MPANPMTAIMSRITHTIPNQILDMAFSPDAYRTTIDDRVLHEVIRGRVLIDVNISTGKSASIILQDGWKEATNVDYYDGISALIRQADVYRVPADARENRDINSVTRVIIPPIINLNPINSSLGALASTYGNSVNNLAQAALQSRTLQEAAVIPRAVLVGRNLIRIFPQVVTIGYILECQLDFDPEFTNIASNMIPPLQDLVTCAVKAYCYNQLVIKIDTNQVVAGQPIGAFKQVIDAYVDENEKYTELLLKFQGANYFDPEKIHQMMYHML